MEGGSAPGPASFGQLDPSVVNGNSTPSPMNEVPVAGPPPGQAGGNPPAPGPAATAMPGPQPQTHVPPPANPPPVSELNNPGEAVLLTEMQELKSAYQIVHKLALLSIAVILAIALGVAYYFSKAIGAKYLPDSPAEPVVVS